MVEIKVSILGLCFSFTAITFFAQGLILHGLPLGVRVGEKHHNGEVDGGVGDLLPGDQEGQLPIPGRGVFCVDIDGGHDVYPVLHRGARRNHGHVIGVAKIPLQLLGHQLPHPRAVPAKALDAHVLLPLVHDPWGTPASSG